MERDKYVTERIEQAKVMTEERKKYIFKYEYLEKIRKYFELEYGECGKEPIIFEENYSDHGDSEQYCSRIAFHVHFKSIYGSSTISDTISFFVHYKFSVVKESGDEWEDFDAYRESDNVYLTFPEGKSKGGIYRSEYKRKWQDDGLSKVFTQPENEEFYSSKS